MGVDEVKSAIRTDLHGPIVDVCLLLVDRLASIPENELRRLTFPLLAQFAHLSPVDKTLHSAITALTTIEHHPLKLYFIFLDVEDETEIEVQASEVMQSVYDGLFIHPRTGDPVPHFKKLIQPAYKITDEFAKLVAERQL